MLYEQAHHSLVAGFLANFVGHGLNTAVGQEDEIGSPGVVSLPRFLVTVVCQGGRLDDLKGQ